MNPPSYPTPSEFLLFGGRVVRDLCNHEEFEGKHPDTVGNWFFATVDELMPGLLRSFDYFCEGRRGALVQCGTDEESGKPLFFMVEHHPANRNTDTRYILNAYPLKGALQKKVPGITDTSKVEMTPEDFFSMRPTHERALLTRLVQEKLISDLQARRIYDNTPKAAAASRAHRF